MCVASYEREIAPAARYFDFAPPAVGALIGAAPEAAGGAPGIGMTPVCTSISTEFMYVAPFTIERRRRSER